MAVVLINNFVTPDDLKIAGEEYGEYIKIVVDIEKEEIGIGGLWHADIERELLNKGSTQKNLWGGGIDTTSNEIDFTSLINIRPQFQNDSMDILDTKIRDTFTKIVKRAFKI